jgi:hypothetical protein
MMCDAHLFGLPTVLQALWSQQWWQLWQRWQPTDFLSEMWHGEAFQRLGVQGVEVSILVGGLFLPSMTPVSQQDFGVTELTLSASIP